MECTELIEWGILISIGSRNIFCNKEINFTKINPNFVTLKIYDMLGREMQTIVSEFQEAGTYSVTLDSRQLTSGVYFYKLKGGMSVVETKRMLLLR